MYYLFNIGIYVMFEKLINTTNIEIKKAVRNKDAHLICMKFKPESIKKSYSFISSVLETQDLNIALKGDLITIEAKTKEIGENLFLIFENLFIFDMKCELYKESKNSKEWLTKSFDTINEFGFLNIWLIKQNKFKDTLFKHKNNHWLQRDYKKIIENNKITENKSETTFFNEQLNDALSFFETKKEASLFLDLVLSFVKKESTTKTELHKAKVPELFKIINVQLISFFENKSIQDIEYLSNLIKHYDNLESFCYEQKEKDIPIEIFYDFDFKLDSNLEYSSEVLNIINKFINSFNFFYAKRNAAHIAENLMYASTKFKEKTILELYLILKPINSTFSPS